MKLHQDTFRPALIIKAFEEEYLRYYPDEINSGWCFQWAYMAYIAFNGVQLYCVPGHAFIKYKCKFYDSEKLRGVVNWQDLPTIWRCCGESVKPKKRTEEDFIKEWGLWGAEMRPDVEDIWKYYVSLVENFDEHKVWRRD